MKARVVHSTGWLTSLVILLLFASGCATATPTVFETPVASLTPEQPQTPLFQAALTANAAKVALVLGGDPERVLQQFETLNVPQGSHILLDDNGRGILRFGDRHEVDLLGGADVVIEDAKLESGGSIFVRLKQNKGHTYITLNDQSIARVTLETGDATITTLEQGSKFAVCYNPAKGVNCIHVDKGAVEITSQGEKQVYREGEATFFLSGQPPQAPFCVQQDVFNEWVSNMRGSGDPRALSALVQDSPPGPCGTPNPETSSVEESVSTPTLTTTATATPLPTLTPTPTRTISIPPTTTPTPTKEPREPKDEDTEEPPTEPAPTDLPPTEPVPTDAAPTDETPTEIPPPPWNPTDTEPAPTDPPSTPTP
jgi:hypothetical protein